MDLVQIAHSSHWLANVMSTLPVVGFLAWLGITTLRERRADRESRRDPPPRGSKGPE